MPTVVILARAGSKGVPWKVLREVGGRTLLRRCVDTCTAADVGEVIVSSDADAILDEARAGGARTVKRPAFLATDTARGWDAMRHVVHCCGLDDEIVMAQATNPFLCVKDIHGTRTALLGKDMAVCVQQCRDLMVNEYGVPIGWRKDQVNRQERQPQYRLAGSVWAFHSSYVADQELYDGRIGLYVTPNYLQVDIDTEEDLELASLLLGSEKCLTPGV